jgi:hypothetical protein
MKYVLIVFTFFLCVPWTSAQQTYNYRLDFDRPTLSVLSSIEVTDSCFYACGVASDSLPPFQLGSIFARLSFEGEVIWYKTLVDTIEYFGTWYNTMEKINESFIVSGTYFDTLGRADLLIKYDADGDTLFTRKYRSPYLPESDFIALISSQKSLNDDGYYMVSNLSNTINSNTDTYLKKVDSLGQLEWGTIYGENENSESVGTILLEEDKIFIGGNIHNINFDNNDYFSRGLLVQMNDEGEVEWEYETLEGELRNLISDILKADDGGYLLASGKGVEVVSTPTNSQLLWQPYVFKLDADRNFEWGVDIRDSFPSTTNGITKMIKVSDDSGYVVAGRSFRPNPAENGYDIMGLIAKISKEGDSLWTRRYNYVQSRSDDHVFYDLEETPDGGFVMVGQAVDFFQPEPPAQRAWIVKVDQHGCLVPGCHLISPTVELQEANFEIKIYPNPATDYLNVYFQHPRLRGTAYFSLVDAKGKVVLEFQSRHEDITHMIPVIGLATGTYWLRCQVGTEVLTKEVLVQ